MASGLGGLYFVIIVVVGILTFCIPFFIFKIRNEVIKMNKQMARIIELLEAGLFENETTETTYQTITNERGDRIKVCSKCEGKNLHEESKCVYCGQRFT